MPRLLEREVMLLDFYDLFSVDKRASKKEIKQAYRKFVKDLKCDKKGCNKEVQNLLEIAREGYLILTHNDLRKRYDMFLNIINGNPVSEDSYYGYEEKKKTSDSEDERAKDNPNQSSNNHNEDKSPPFSPNREKENVSDEKFLKIIKYILIGIGIFTVFTTPWLFFIAIIVFLIWVKSSKK